MSHLNKAKGRISKRMFQENKARQIFRKTNISYPLIRTRNVRFSENLVRFLFLKHALWDWFFWLINDDLVRLRQISSQLLTKRVPAQALTVLLKRSQQIGVFSTIGLLTAKTLLIWAISGQNYNSNICSPLLLGRSRPATGRSTVTYEMRFSWWFPSFTKWFGDNEVLWRDMIEEMKNNHKQQQIK